MVRRGLLVVSLALACSGCTSSPRRQVERYVKPPRKAQVSASLQLRRAFWKARKLERPGLAINALKAVEARVPDAPVRPRFRRSFLNRIERELNKRIRKPIPLEEELIELAVAHPTPPRPKRAKRKRAKRKRAKRRVRRKRAPQVEVRRGRSTRVRIVQTRGRAASRPRSRRVGRSWRVRKKDLKRALRERLELERVLRKRLRRQFRRKALRRMFRFR